MPLSFEKWQLSLVPRCGSSPDSRWTEWGQGGANVCQGDENTDPYGLTSLWPRSVLLQTTVSSPLSLPLSSRCLFEKILDRGSWKRKGWVRRGITRCNILPPWGNLFPNCEGISWVVKSWQIQQNLCGVFTTEPCPISEYGHFRQARNDREGVISLSRIRTLLLEIR
jgi:hypothetical protein